MRISKNSLQLFEDIDEYGRDPIGMIEPKDVFQLLEIIETPDGPFAEDLRLWNVSKGFIGRIGVDSQFRHALLEDYSVQIVLTEEVRELLTSYEFPA